MHALKFEARIPVDQISIDEVLFEVNSGLRCLRAMQEIFLSGDSKNRDEPMDTNDFYIQNVFKKFYEYVVNATFCFEQAETELMDAVGFVHALGISVELYSFDTLRQCESLIVYAAARAKIDFVAGYPTWDVDGYSYFLGNGSYGNLTISEVALLAGMDEKSVRNATQLGKQDRLITQKSKNGVYVNAKDALDWLKRRQSFRPTKCPPGIMDQTDNDDYVLVPRAFDGTVFSANCKQGNSFKVGKRGEEIKEPSIWDALEKLKSMKKAYWRRPNENGHYSLVSAHEWVKIKKEDFLAT